MGRYRDAMLPACAGELITAALRQAGLTDQARRLQLYQVWQQAVGREIAAATQPHSFSRGVLTVKAASAAWQNELTFLKSDIITQLNAFLGGNQVKDLRVMAGRLEDRDSKRQRGYAMGPKATRQDKEAADAVAACIEDNEVREAFARMMAQATTRQKGGKS